MNGTTESRTLRQKLARPRTAFQTGLTLVGARMTSSQIRVLNACLNYLETGRWLKSHGFDGFPRYGTREDLHRALALPVRDQRVLYLEFGVFQGASLLLWSALLRNSDSKLHGFDSFEGLPEDWDGQRQRATFSTAGNMPHFEDARVALHKGWFDETLQKFEVPNHEVLIAHLDADLYSSTALVLKFLAPAMQPGTILIFDEFCDRYHEQRAFDEFRKSHGTSFECVGATRNLEHVAMRVCGQKID